VISVPMHEDFQNIKQSMIEQHGTEKAEQVYNGWVSEHGCDDTISMEKNHELNKCMTGECLRKIHTQFPYYPIEVHESMVAGKPLKIAGVAAKVGLSRNSNEWTPDAIKELGKALKGASIYGEHVSVFDAIGKVVDTWFKSPYLYYEGEIYDDQLIVKIKKGIIRHVSPAADYSTFETVNGIRPSGIPKNAEMSLVAVAGIPSANIQILESLGKLKEQEQEGGTTKKMKRLTVPFYVNGQPFAEWFDENVLKPLARIEQHLGLEPMRVAESRSRTRKDTKPDEKFMEHEKRVEGKYRGL